MTLPLSYSRLRAHARHSFALRRASPPLFPTAAHLRVSPIFATHSGGRRLVAREGLEPSKPLGRQIYSLLRLTASLPRQLAVMFGKRLFRLPATGSPVDGAGEGIRTPDLLITNQLLYQTELRQPRQKVNFSTSRATLQAPAGLGDRRGNGTPEAGNNLSLYSFSGALPYHLEQRDPGRHRHVQTLNVSRHRNGDQPVASLPHEAA